ncbi:YjgF-like protein [Pisolithus croceorrhizus]|nr:YjgF-like protein [Pisolithus croceorrhizus]
MDTVQRYRTANPYEKAFGYCRALRKGPFIFVFGATAVDLTTGQVAHPSSAYQQALKACKDIVVAVESLERNKTDIVRVRMFVTHENDATEVARALKEGMGEVEPTATMILGAKFVSPDMRVEIEADAVVSL